MTPPFRTILGISFFTGSLDDALEIARGGGLILVPSGPGLANLTRDPAYRAALENSNLNLTDSGLMVLTWFVRSGERVERLSGLRFLRGLLDDSDFRARGSSYWIMPSAREERINLRWLEGRGISVASQSSYVAPLFSGPEVEDEKLIDVLQKKRPQYILINIGGGVQEKLGYYLKRRLSYVPTIVCTGAAIAFLTGQQATIPVWADRLFLGWLFRCLRSPAEFMPRYWQARRLVGLILKYGAHRPPQEEG